MIPFFKTSQCFRNIKARFTLVAIAISFLSFGVAAFFSIHWLNEEIQEDYKAKAVLMGTHIAHDFGTAMISQNHQSIRETLDLYRNYEGVEELRLFNRNGEEIFFKKWNPPEARVMDSLSTGESIHFHKRFNNQEVVSYINPIRNNPECQGCHAQKEPLLGALLLSMNQKQMDYDMTQQRRRFIILFGLIAFLVGVATIAVVNRLFLRPLSFIQEGTNAIARGEFKYQIPIQSRDEIGILGEHFNLMAQALQDKNEKLLEQVRVISQSQKEWQETFDGITDLIAVIDKDFNITRSNRAFRQYFSLPLGREPDKKCYEIIGTCLQGGCPHKTAPREKEALANEITDPNTGRILQISVFPFYPPDDFTGSIFIAKDISEKKENEMKLIMNERLAALGEMASGIVHELNNPLATISACTESLLMKVKKEKIDSSFFENYLRIMGEELERCKKISTGILSFVRRTKNDRREIDIHEVLNKVVESIDHQGRLKEVEVTRSFAKEIPRVQANEGELMQVFASITGNALDAMEDKGCLTFETGADEKGVFVKISDTGPGIPPESIPKIFKPFFTTKPTGTGLGLAIVDKIIKENNGKIEVNSDPQRGTTFTVTLPL
jgi:signal transduction histidine kinase